MVARPYPRLSPKCRTMSRILSPWNTPVLSTFDKQSNRLVQQHVRLNQQAATPLWPKGWKGKTTAHQQLNEFSSVVVIWDVERIIHKQCLGHIGTQWWSCMSGPVLCWVWVWQGATLTSYIMCLPRWHKETSNAENHKDSWIHPLVILHRICHEEPNKLKNHL